MAGNPFAGKGKGKKKGTTGQAPSESGTSGLFASKKKGGKK
jgi:hypothetical protein